AERAVHGACGVDPSDESLATLESVERDRAHPRHDAEADHDVERVGYLDAHLTTGRAARAHQIGHDIHRATGHAPVEDSPEQLLRLATVHPVIGRTRISLVGR